MHSKNSLKTKTLSGLFWSFSDIISNQGIQFIIQIILARLLLPEDFGIIGMITVFIAVSNSIIDSGFKNALIREKNPSQEDYSTVFYFNLFTAIVMYFVLYYTAPHISEFYSEPSILGILRVLSLVLIINAFGLIQRTMLIIKIDFKNQTKINIFASAVSGIVAIILASLGFGVWSLVYRILVMQFLQALLLSLNNRWWPSLSFSIASFRRFFSFGWKLLISGLINTLYKNIYLLIIGRVYTATDLGYYTNANKLRDAVSESITTSVQRVSYPVLSSIQSENEQLRNGYKKIIKNSVFITFPVMIGLTVIAEPIIQLLFGEKWLPSIPYFQLLCLGSMLFPLHAINLNILQVKGRSDLFLKLEVVKKIISIGSIGIVLYLKLGIIALLWASIINSYIAYFINSYYSAELLAYSTKEQIKDILPSYLISIVMGILVFWIGSLIAMASVVKLLIQIIVGISVYILLANLLKIDEIKTIKTVINHLFNKQHGEVK